MGDIRLDIFLIYYHGDAENAEKIFKIPGVLRVSVVGFVIR